MDLVIQQGIDALSLGSLYALIALGIALIFGIMRLINFAHGEFIMLGGYSMLLVMDKPAVLLLLAPLVVPVVVALATDRVAFKPVRGESAATLLITSFAVAYLLQNVVSLVYTSTARAVRLPVFATESFAVAGYRISKVSVLTVLGAAVIVVGLRLFMKRTRLGIHMRAAAEDFTMARLLGVRANRVIATAFAMSGVLAGAVALSVVADRGTITPTMGVSLVLVGFVGTVIGGLGSVAAAGLGGFVLGVASVSLQATLPVDLRPYRDAFVFGLVIVILLVRPHGLFAPRRRNVVA